jgi:hypothetical protein
MSLVTYNGVVLPYPMHSQFSQEAVKDESGTDWMYLKFDIAVQCVVSSDYMRLLLPDLEGVRNPDSPAAVMTIVRTRLMEQRKKLSVIVNGVELIPRSPNGVTIGIDAKNGPEPKTVDITALNSEAFIVTFRIVAHYWQSTNQEYVDDRLSPPTATGSPVLNNRWSETVQIDKFLASTRTRSGTFVIRSDNAERITADQIRTQMAVLGLPDGFMRESATYTQSTDGLSIKYDIVDREYFKAPPKGAYEASGQLTINTSRLGAITTGEVRLTLKGTNSDAFSPQSKLLLAAVSIASQKLYVTGAQTLGEVGKRGRGFAYLERASVSIDMYQNTVTVVIAARIQRGKKRIAGTTALGSAAFMQQGFLTKTPGSEGTRERPVTLDRGTAGILLQAAAYYDPSLRNNALVEGKGFVPNPFNIITPKFGAQMNTGKVPGTAGGDV